MQSNVHVTTLTWWEWLLVAAVLLCQGIFIFQDAQKRGAKAWLWGMYGLSSCPTAFIVYYFCVMRKRKKKPAAE